LVTGGAVEIHKSGAIQINVNETENEHKVRLITILDT